jgi:hypothetical protein
MYSEEYYVIVKEIKDGEFQYLSTTIHFCNIIKSALPFWSEKEAQDYIDSFDCLKTDPTCKIKKIVRDYTLIL